MQYLSPFSATSPSHSLVSLRFWNDLRPSEVCCYVPLLSVYFSEWDRHTKCTLAVSSVVKYNLIHMEVNLRMNSTQSCLSGASVPTADAARSRDRGGWEVRMVQPAEGIDQGIGNIHQCKEFVPVICNTASTHFKCFFSLHDLNKYF